MAQFRFVSGLWELPFWVVHGLALVCGDDSSVGSQKGGKTDGDSLGIVVEPE